MELITYRPLLWLLLLLPLALFYVRSLVERQWVLKLSSFVLRGLAIAFLATALCQPFFARERDYFHVIHLLDVSESVDLQSCRRALDRVQRLDSSLRPSDSSTFCAFAQEVREAGVEDFRKELEQWQRGTADDTFRRSSRIASALVSVRMNFPAEKAKRIILYSDGQETEGGLDEALLSLRQESIDLRFAPLEGVQAAEASVVSLEGNTPSSYQGEKVRLTATLSSNCEMKGELCFVARGVIERRVPVQLREGDKNTVSCDVVMNRSGSNVWTAELLPEKDHFPMNNRASCTIDVVGRAKVLALHRKPGKLRPFARALREQGIEVETRGEFGLPGTVTELLEFDALLLANFPATLMGPREMTNLKKYVTDFGGGLIMLGSENSFGLGGYYKTPVEEVLPLVSRYEKEKEKPSLTMVLVIDKSGSMSGLPIALARQAAKATAELLGPRDKIGVVGFDSQPYTVCEITSATDLEYIHSAIDGIAAGGGTNMYPAMAEGRDMLEQTVAKIKHMIVLGDGMSMPGDFEGLAAEMADGGITVSTVALGPSADRGLMQAIAQIGKGRYYETMDANTVPQIFTKETMEASRSAIKEEPFVPVPLRSADFLNGINFDECPFLLGYVMTRGKPTAEMQLLTESGDPLLATGKFGLGKSVAFTSDVTEQWAGEWIEWTPFGRFWAQVLRSCIRKDKDTGISVSREKRGPLMQYIIHRKDEAGQPVNGVRWQASLVGEHGLDTALAVEEIGLGLYRAQAARPGVGRWSVRFNDSGEGQLKVLHHHHNYPKEYRLAQQPPDAIRALPVLDEQEFLQHDSLPTIDTQQSARHYSLLLAIICILGSVLLRRV